MLNNNYKRGEYFKWMGMYKNNTGCSQATLAGTVVVVVVVSVSVSLSVVSPNCRQATHPPPPSLGLLQPEKDGL